jgi:type VI protein secretion system component VasF
MPAENHREEQLLREAGDRDDDPRRLPPRRVIHSREKGTGAEWFYRTLVLLFILLLVGLFLWGDHYLSQMENPVTGT